MGEVSGTLGDLGTFLPHIVGAITVVKMDPTGILTTFGLFYAFTGVFYGVPMAVQPMKAASAAVLIEPMEPAAIAGAGLVIGAVFLILGLTGVVEPARALLPGSIAAGLQLGLGLSLAALGIRLIESQLWLGVAMSALMLGLMRYPRSPAALVAVFVGVGAGQILGIAPPLPALDFGLHLPHLVIPSWVQIVHGTEYAVLPQIPVDLDQCDHRHGGRFAATFRGSCSQSTSATSRSRPASGISWPRPSAAISCAMGRAESPAISVRGPHRDRPGADRPRLYRVGRGLRRGRLCDARAIPDAVLGGLLLFSGIELALSSKLHEHRGGDLFLVLLMAAIGVALNPAAAFAVGLPGAYALKRGWLGFEPVAGELLE